MCGALMVVNDKGVKFKVGSGLTDKQRRNPPKKGSTITYKF
jgi:DNA ligase-1|tara:strand:+ start:469 stop:591 length:123 start_codon:yes stop_codon:yes gene_type:complete